MKKRGNKEFLVAFIALLSIAVISVLFAPVFARIILVDQAPPSATSISCSVSSSSVSLGNTLTVTGSITPSVANATVTLTYTKQNAPSITRTVITAADGSYSDAYTPDSSGSWTVYATWAGNDNYFGASSFNAPFTINSNSTNNNTYIYLAVMIVVVVIVVLVVVLLRKKKQP